MATKKVITKEPLRVNDSRETFVSIRKSFTDAGDVQAKLLSLWSLQTIDTALDKIYQLRGELPAEVEALENKISELGAKAAQVNESIRDAEKKIAEYQIQYTSSCEQAAKYQAQIDAGIENSREYDSLCKEIENQDLLGQVAQKKIGEAKEFIAQKKEDLESVKERILVREEDLKVKKEELEQIAVSTARDEEKLLADRAVQAEKIDARTMSAYERIRKSVKNHMAIATVLYGSEADAKDRVKGVCGGCNCEVAPQKLIDIAASKKMVICEYCGRILVNPDASSEEA